jgi:hypothetical protein
MRKIGREAIPRLVKPAQDNFVGVLLMLATILYTASQHHWSKKTLVSNLWETIVVPCILVICCLMCLHILQVSKSLYVKERRTFINALGKPTTLPPFRFRWRCYVATTIWWLAPIALITLIWSKYPIALPGQSRFIVDANTNILLPDLHILSNLPPQTLPPEKDKPPTMLDLFAQDFPAAMKVQYSLTLKGTSLPLKEQLYLDFSAKSKFVGLYVPFVASDVRDGGQTTTTICEAFPNESEAALQRVEKNTPIQGGMIDNARTLSELTFTNEVIIYHENILSIQEKSQIITQFKDADLDVEFRGPEYRDSRVSTWWNNHDASKNKK